MSCRLGHALPLAARCRNSVAVFSARRRSQRVFANQRFTIPVVAGVMPDPCIPETEKERSTLDFPQEWLTPTPSRRPDIFPEFEKLKTPLPKPMPGDPELPDEEEEERKEKEKKPDEEKEKKEGEEGGDEKKKEEKKPGIAPAEE